MLLLTSPRSTISKASLVSIVLASIAGVAFVVVVVASWLGPEALTDVAWVAVGLGLCLVSVFLLRHVVAWFGRQELFSPLIAFPITYAVWFAVGSLTLEDGAARILKYSAAGLACYFAGVLLAGWRTALNPSRPVVRNEWVPSRFWSVIGVLGVMTFLSYAYVVSQVGIVALDPEAAEVRGELVKYGPVEAVLFTATWTILVLVTAQLWSHRDRLTRRRVAWLGLLAVAVILLSLGSRGYLFVPALTAVIGSHYLRKRFHVLTLALIGAVVFMALSFYGYTRDSTLTTGTFSLKDGNAVQLAIYPLIYAYLYVSQPVETLHDVTQVIPRTIPYQRGMLTFDALRTLLPGHHEMSDMFFKQILGSDFVGGGQPATLLGPLYGDFGLIGILVGMFLVGIIVTRTYARMLAKPNVFRILIYAWVMQTVLFSLFGALIPYITTLWIPLVWWFLDAVCLRKPAFALGVPPLDQGATT